MIIIIYISSTHKHGLKCSFKIIFKIMQRLFDLNDMLRDMYETNIYGETHATAQVNWIFLHLKLKMRMGIKPHHLVG